MFFALTWLSSLWCMVIFHTIEKMSIIPINDFNFIEQSFIFVVYLMITIRFFFLFI